MRKQEKIKINDKNIIIKELRVKDIYKFGSKLSKLKDGVKIEDLKGVIEEILPEVSDLNSDDLMELSFSELEELETIFWKVNESFLRRLDQLGIKGKILKAVKTDLVETVST